ncbi:MAG: GGDEF domain-containing protein [Burkholderiales bacterium]|nr:GGDEF domain-containing protein [Burkholderiales bacterium]
MLIKPIASQTNFYKLLIGLMPALILLATTVGFSVITHLKSVEFAESLRQLRALERTSSALYFAGVEFKDGAIGLFLEPQDRALHIERYSTALDNLRSQMIVASARTEKIPNDNFLKKLDVLMEEIESLNVRILNSQSDAADKISDIKILNFVIQRWLMQVEAINAAVHLKTIQLDTALDDLQKSSLMVFAYVLVMCVCMLTWVLGRWYRWRSQQLDREAFLSRMAEVDELTGLLNRRGWERICKSFDDSPQQLSDGLTLVMVDLDHFKQFNDTQGHAAGDHLLRQFGTLLKKSSRPNDALARIGGEEFVLALPQCSVKAAEQLILRLRSSPELIIGFSAGIAEVKIGERVCDALARADRALYRAKHLGRSRTCLDLQSPHNEIQTSISAQIV